MKTSVIIVAAGKGKRMGRDYNKQYILLRDKPIVAHTIEVFENINIIDEIVLVVAQGEVNWVGDNIIDKYKFKKVTKVLEGGKERQNSVYNGLKGLDKDCSIVLVHDGARPFITEEIIRESIQVAKEVGAALVAVPVKDTIKLVNKNMQVDRTPNRQLLWAVQTPQTFKYKLLLESYEKMQNTSINFTDDAMLVEEFGHTIQVVEGSYENIKITTPEDLIVGEGILQKRVNS